MPDHTVRLVLATVRASAPRAAQGSDSMDFGGEGEGGRGTGASAGLARGGACGVVIEAGVAGNRP